MAEVQKLNGIIKIIRVAMYLLVGIAIVFLPIPLFKNVNLSFKIAMGILFALYSAFRIYQLIQEKKNESDQ